MTPATRHVPTKLVSLASSSALVGEQLAALLVARLGLPSERRVVFGVAGESGSGKSTTAVALTAALNAAGISTLALPQDDYFLRPPRANHDHRLGDLARVGPHEVDLTRLAEHVAAFCAGAEVTIPVVDRAADRFVDTPLDFSPYAALVVEGTYVLGLPDLDARIFMDASYEDTRERRRLRARDVDAPIVEQILGIEHRLIAPYRDVADIVIDRDFVIRTR